VKISWKWLDHSNPQSAIRAGPQLKDSDIVNAFRVPENENWWRAVLQVIDELERETIQGARNYVANTNMCISAVGGGEALAELRGRLVALREKAVAGRDQTSNIEHRTSNIE
jgi:hypothetical protein